MLILDIEHSSVILSQTSGEVITKKCQDKVQDQTKWMLL